MALWTLYISSFYPFWCTCYLRAQAFCPETPVERFDERIVCRLAGPRKIQCDALGVGPKVKVARDELRALIDTDRLWIANSGAGALQRLHDVFRSIAEARIDDWREARERVHDREHPDFSAGRQLIVDEVHRPSLVRFGRRLPVVAQFCFDSPFRRLVTQLKAKLIVNPVGFLDVDVPAVATQQHMHAPIAVAHARRANLLDSGFDAGLIGATGFVVVSGRVEFENPARAPDRNVPLLANPCRQLALATRP